jgi:hypothetical protein
MPRRRMLALAPVYDTYDAILVTQSSTLAATPGTPSSQTPTHPLRYRTRMGTGRNLTPLV